MADHETRRTRWMMPPPGRELHFTPTGPPAAPRHRRRTELDSANRFGTVDLGLSACSTSVPDSAQSAASSEQSIGWIPEPWPTVPAIPDSWGGAELQCWQGSVGTFQAE